MHTSDAAAYPEEKRSVTEKVKDALGGCVGHGHTQHNDDLTHPTTRTGLGTGHHNGTELTSSEPYSDSYATHGGHQGVLSKIEETLGTNTTTGIGHDTGHHSVAPGGTGTGYGVSTGPGFGPTGTTSGSGDQGAHGSGYGATGSAPGYGAGHHAATGDQGTGYGATGNGAGMGTGVGHSTGYGHQAGYGPTGNGTGYGHQGVVGKVEDAVLPGTGHHGVGTGHGGVGAAATGYDSVGSGYATGTTGTGHNSTGGGGGLLAKAKEKLAGHKH